MSTTDERHETSRYAFLWARDSDRWVIWTTDKESVVFDTRLNLPFVFDDASVAADVLDRMRRAGVRESLDYPGRPC